MFDIRSEEQGLVAHGVSTCAGCGMELIIRNVLDVLGRDVILVIPPGCSALFCGFNQETGLKVAAFQGNLENSAANAAGISRGLRFQGNDHTIVVAFAGDGATLDIGLQSLSGMMERGDDVLYICYDNEAYMNTGIQSSSSTPYGAWSTTTPGGKHNHKKDLLGIAIAHGIPYCASASVANIRDLRHKVEKAKAIHGPRLLHVQCPCPTGWGYQPAKSVEICKNAIDSAAWLLYECDHGKLIVNYRPQPLKPITEFFKYQARFKNITAEETEALQAAVEKNYQALLKKAEQQ